MMQIAIIGAGVAGLAAAQRLAGYGVRATLYEKSRGVGGRAATRRAAGCVFDHGAQYVKAPTPALAALIAAGEPPHDIGLPVWTFTASGLIAEGDPLQNAEPKWIWPGGITTLAKAMAAGLDVRLGAQVARVRRTVDGRPWTAAAGLPSPGSGSGSSGYELLDAAGGALGIADGVLFTAPAPQTAAILAASELQLDGGTREALLAELGQATYRRCIAVTLAYPRRPAVPWYALVNTDRAHAISWLACEHTKLGHAPAGIGLLIAQMAHGWSMQHWEDLERGTYERSPEGLLPQPLAAVASQVAMLVGDDLGGPQWADVQRWRYALPDSFADFARLNSTGSGLFFAGDYVAELGRVHLAIESGWRVADLIGAARPS